MTHIAHPGESVLSKTASSAKYCSGYPQVAAFHGLPARSDIKQRAIDEWADLVNSLAHAANVATRLLFTWTQGWLYWAISVSEWCHTFFLDATDREQ